MVTDDAPITQVMLTVQFVPPAVGLNPIDIAEIYAPLRSEYPLIEQISRAGPMPLAIDAMGVSFDPSTAARMRFSSQDGSLSIYLQDDRFSFSWDRRTSLRLASGYPGFEAIFDRAESAWKSLNRALGGKLPGDRHPSVCEIAYVDAFETVDFEGTPRRLSSIFAFLNPNIPPAPMVGSFIHQWTEPTGVRDGFIQTQIQGPVLSADGVPAAVCQMTSRFRPEPEWEQLRDGFLELRQQIRLVFQRVVSSTVRPT